jgi:5'-3' exonuclease
MGVVTWPMIEYEADDALAAGAKLAAEDKRVGQVVICTPDKDLAQSVVGTRIVQLDRRRRLIRDEEGVKEKFGVPPTSIPDYLAVVGDSADGFPGLPGWGAKSSAAVLARYKHLEAIPYRLAIMGGRCPQPKKASGYFARTMGRSFTFSRPGNTPQRYAPLCVGG